MKTRVNDWIDTKTGAVMYGVQVRCQGQWMNVCDGSKPCVFDRKEDRDALRKTLQRTKDPTT